QAGYNTVAEALALGRRMVLVPFAVGRETEQTTRARAVERAGAAVVVPEADLDAQTLETAVRSALQRPFPELNLALDGAATSARLLEALVENAR
ncbi:MAG: glycosyltransferase, partial [Pseudomonadota bacterium]